ncbi:hypothetical protein AA0483_1808 [Acetobacter syzygii NRIC 0483]|nr:hypothetical protein AA0483_1808 [Acetobacter syzygii NRIC 0483]
MGFTIQPALACCPAGACSYPKCRAMGGFANKSHKALNRIFPVTDLCTKTACCNDNNTIPRGSGACQFQHPRAYPFGE